MISCEDPEPGITLTLSAVTSLNPEPFCFIHVIVGTGMPLALHVKLVESPVLEVCTDDLYGITILALGGSKDKDDQKLKTNSILFLMVVIID